MRGAGGTPGGVGQFILGLVLLSSGLYLLLSSIVVQSGFGFGSVLWRMGGFGLTSGAMLVPLLVGIGVIFFSARNPIGWVLALGSLVAIILGVIMSLQIRIRSMSMLEMLIILILIGGGTGLFLKSLYSSEKKAG